MRSLAGRAVATAAAGPAGVVQLNVPFREPLLPDGAAPPREDGGRPRRPSRRRSPRPSPGRPVLDEELVADLAALLGRTPRGLIVAGPDDDPELPAALAGLALATGFPILADPLSGLRTRARTTGRGSSAGPTSSSAPGPWIDAHRPDLVIRTGAMPTSKPILQLLERVRPGARRDRRGRRLARAGAAARDLRPRGRRGDGTRADGAPRVERPAHVVDRATGRTRSAPRRGRWTRWLAALDEPFEGAPFPALAAALPDGAVLWAGNSMPVRDLDGWLPSTERAITVRSNRGANGIDGVVSTALGSAAASDGPVALVVGDISFLHDLNALVDLRGCTACPRRSCW